MKDESKTKAELIDELNELRKRVPAPGQAEAQREALRESDDIFRTLVTNSEEIVYMIAKDGTFTLSEGRGLEKLGLKPGAVVGASVYDLYKDFPEMLDAMKRAFNGERVVVEVVVAGTHFRSWYSPHLDRNGEIAGLLGLSVDLTEQRQADEARKRSEELLSVTLRSIGDAVITTDQDGGVTFMNPTAEAATGWPLADAAGRPLEEVFDIRNEDTGQTVESPVKQVFREGVVVGLANHTKLVRRDGTELPIADSGAPIRDNNGEIVGAVLVFQDVTERRKTENELRERVKELQCLHDVSEVIDTVDDRDDMIAKVARCIPVGWQYPEITRARILFDGQQHVSSDFDATPWLQSSDIIVAGQRRGAIDVFHLEERPTLDEGPFLEQERQLIDSLARVVGEAVQRRESEETLSESEGRYRTLTEAAQDIIFISTHERLLYINSAGAQFFGKPLDQVVGQSLDDLFPPGPLVQQRDAITKVLATGKPVNMVQRFELPSGDCWIDYTLVALSDNLVPDAVMGIARDVTEKIFAEQRHSAILRAALDGFGLVDTDGRYLEVNDSYLAMTGYSRDELLSMHVRDVEMVMSPQETAAQIEKIMTTGGDRFETRHRRKDGTEMDVEVSVNVLPMEGGRMVVFVRDITERKRAENELRRYEHIVSASDDMLALLDSRYVYLAANTAYMSAFNKRPDELIGSTVAQVFGEPFFLDVIKPHADRSLAGETVRYEAWFEFPAYEPRWMEIAYSPYFGDGTVPVGFTVNGRNITAQKRAEEEILKLNDDLEARVQQRTVELTAANRELETFAYSVSHDLRAPLRGIDGFSKALYDDYGDKLDDTGKDYIGRVRAGSQRMGKLIDDLLKLSRLTRTEMIRVRLDLGDLAATIIGELRHSEPDRQVDFTAAGRVEAHGDRALLSAALANLLGNAWKFTGQREHATIEFGVTERHGERVYYIRDNGAGFDMAYADKLFGAFQRLHDTTEFPGTGIGLAIVNRVILRHGGRMWAEGEVDKGATFYFTLTTTVPMASAGAES